MQLPGTLPGPVPDPGNIFSESPAPDSPAPNIPFESLLPAGHEFEEETLEQKRPGDKVETEITLDQLVSSVFSLAPILNLVSPAPSLTTLEIPKNDFHDAESISICSGSQMEKPTVKVASPNPPKAEVNAAEIAHSSEQPAENPEISPKNVEKSAGTPTAKPEKQMFSVLDQIEIAEPPVESTAREVSCESPKPGLGALSDFPQLRQLEIRNRVPNEVNEVASAAQAIDRPDVGRTLVHAVREQVILMRQLNETEMRVVVPASAKSELHLELCQREGVMEIAGTCDHNSFAELNRHWPELKEALLEQGVHVSDLEFSEESATGKDEREGTGKGRRDVDQPELEWNEEFAPVKIQFKPKAGSKQSGWQSWA